MIFVDTNVLLDLIEDSATPEADWSRTTLATQISANPLVSNLIVAAELSAQIDNVETLQDTLASVDVALIDLDLASAHRAGRAFREYRRRGGERQAILADFLIAAHAATMGAQLMTRDRRLGRYFPELPLITPETHPHG